MKHLLFIIAVGCGGLAALAQSVSSGTTPAPENVIRTNTNLVLVDVVVTKKDKPVRGLVRSDFHILDDGKEQGIVSFDPRAPGDAPAPSHQPAMFQDAGAPHTYTNLSPYPPA